MYANKSFFLLQKNEIKTLCTLEDYEIKIMKLLFPNSQWNGNDLIFLNSQSAATT
jgi:hypothetical protein